MSQGRAIRRMVTLYDSVKDLINENDRRCDIEGDDDDVTFESAFHLHLLIAADRLMPVKIGCKPDI